ncbi:MAG: type II toxin-antitoxin system VapC family toxin [Desulfocapsaceae bacterium]|nr:type II toxin-antitoxin system VapC family toxin [Desulfocapsaceae bacterium]
MIGLDTNILVRYITQDDLAQSSLATQFIEEKCSFALPGFINHIVLCELVWVLKRCYKTEMSQALRVVEQLLRTAQLRIQEPQVVWKALKLAQKGKADFADFLIAQINIAHGCGTTITFDNAAAEINSKTLLA